MTLGWNEEIYVWAETSVIMPDSSIERANRHDFHSVNYLVADAFFFMIPPKTHIVIKPKKAPFHLINIFSRRINFGALRFIAAFPSDVSHPSAGN